MFAKRARAEAIVTLLELSDGQWTIEEVDALTLRLAESGAEVSFRLRSPRTILIAGEHEQSAIAEILKDFGRSNFRHEKVQGYDNQRLPWFPF